MGRLFGRVTGHTQMPESGNREPGYLRRAASVLAPRPKPAGRGDLPPEGVESRPPENRIAYTLRPGPGERPNTGMHVQIPLYTFAPLGGMEYPDIYERPVFLRRVPDDWSTQFEVES